MRSKRLARVAGTAVPNAAVCTPCPISDCPAVCMLRRIRNRRSRRVHHPCRGRLLFCLHCSLSATTIYSTCLSPPAPAVSSCACAPHTAAACAAFFAPSGTVLLLFSASRATCPPRVVSFSLHPLPPYPLSLSCHSTPLLLLPPFPFFPPSPHPASLSGFLTLAFLRLSRAAPPFVIHLLFPFSHHSLQYLFFSPPPRQVERADETFVSPSPFCFSLFLSFPFFSRVFVRRLCTPLRRAFPKETFTYLSCSHTFSRFFSSALCILPRLDAFRAVLVMSTVSSISVLRPMRPPRAPFFASPHTALPLPPLAPHALWRSPVSRETVFASFSPQSLGVFCFLSPHTLPHPRDDRSLCRARRRMHVMHADSARPFAWPLFARLTLFLSAHAWNAHRSLFLSLSLSPL